MQNFCQFLHIMVLLIEFPMSSAAEIQPQQPMLQCLEWFIFENFLKNPIEIFHFSVPEPAIVGTNRCQKCALRTHIATPSGWHSLARVRGFKNREKMGEKFWRTLKVSDKVSCLKALGKN